jgi:hypothetical protein
MTRRRATGRACRVWAGDGAARGGLLLRDLHDGSDFALAALTLDGVITGWSSSAEWLSGYAVDDVMGSRLARRGRSRPPRPLPSS